jgi:serine/threonine protein kinase
MRSVFNLTLKDLKPENLLYLTTAPDSDLVLADFGIAKMLDTQDEVLTTMAGSFGYAAPEVMLKKGHGKPVDMWSLGVITYTLLCGYSPFRSENLQDLIDECCNGKVVFHERYWKDVSDDAKNFIGHLLQPDPEDRTTSEVSQILLQIDLYGFTYICIGSTSAPMAYRPDRLRPQFASRDPRIHGQGTSTPWH